MWTNIGSAGMARRETAGQSASAPPRFLEHAIPDFPNPSTTKMPNMPPMRQRRAHVRAGGRLVANATRPQMLCRALRRLCNGSPQGQPLGGGGHCWVAGGGGARFRHRRRHASRRRRLILRTGLRQTRIEMDEAQPHRYGSGSSHCALDLQLWGIRTTLWADAHHGALALRLAASSGGSCCSDGVACGHAMGDGGATMLCLVVMSWYAATPWYTNALYLAAMPWPAATA